MKKTLKHVIKSYMSKTARLCLSIWISGITAYSCMAMENIDEGRPNEHFCPITLEVMRNPVVASDGYSYERDVILKHMNINSKSPITNLPLKNKDLIDNHALKTMIQEWKPGRQSGPSELDTRKADDIAQRVKEEFLKNAALLDSAKDQHIVAFLGNTGAGKSTLVNLLAGKKLRVSDDGEDYVLVDPYDSASMVIGTGGSSETLYPKCIDVDGLRFFDLPGFNDTDGSERNLVNAAFTRQILLDAASVRLVFVAGQDQFTADRSASVKQMFNSIKQLFVVGENISLVDDGVFVATKITCTAQTEMTDFLLKRTDSRDKAELNEQLKSWNQRNKLCRVFHPIREDNNLGVRDQILKLIKETRPSKIHGINVSVLYPPDTKEPLERMFLSIIEAAFNRKVDAPIKNLSGYDKAITFYTSKDFWPTFDADVCREEDGIGLLKDFCINPYNKAFKNFEKNSERELNEHIKKLERRFVDIFETELKRIWKEPHTTLTEYDQDIIYYTSNNFWSRFSENVYHKDATNGTLPEVPSTAYTKALKTLKEENLVSLEQHVEHLRDGRRKRVKDIETKTHERAKEVTSSIIPKNEDNDFVGFDFAHHKDFYDQVCGASSIGYLATDSLEQEVVRRYYAGFISRHSHGQMMRWHQKFSGVEDLKKQLEATQQKLYALVEEPLIKAREAEAERQMMQAQELARQKAAEAERIRLSVPLIAQGHEAVYLRFLKGVLIYRPNKGSDDGMVTLRISDLVNPLEGTFDLSQCGDTGNYLSISTGYRKVKKPENANKVEIWFTPRFLIERELDSTAAHFKPIMDNWKQDVAPVGMFWTWGRVDNLDYYDYLTTENMENLSKIELYENHKKSEWPQEHAHLLRIHAMGDIIRISAPHGAAVVRGFMFCL